MHAIWSWKPFIFLIFLVPHSKGKLLEVDKAALIVIDEIKLQLTSFGDGFTKLQNRHQNCTNRLQLYKDPTERYPPVFRKSVWKLIKDIKKKLGLVEKIIKNVCHERVPQTDPGSEPDAELDTLLRTGTALEPYTNRKIHQPRSPTPVTVAPTKLPKETCVAVQTDLKKANGDMELKQVMKCTEN
ncbi:uncharacterized protein Dana_GF26622 [Drosophila ananassae]|uniref:Uncharacterized protein n=1 Tax=Drosophila ananassae TaxID=7217 RepID=A0A0P8ZI45_DROAN|nr:uncharacterized protein LOC26514031 [Drosophila ananassae]KPU74394.1 uncharacterized protein Dana_GF26622 [Drosophila ananassae]